jgi:Protein kinase domain
MTADRDPSATPLDLSVRLRTLAADDPHRTGVTRALRHPLHWSARAVALLAMAKIAGAFLALAADSAPTLDTAVGPGFVLLQLLSFGGAGTVLVVAHAGDRRTANLGVVLTLVASAFAAQLFARVGSGVPGLALLVPLHPDAFLPFFLGSFTQEFPRRRIQPRWHRVLLVLVGLSLVVGVLLFVTNALLGWASGFLRFEGLTWLARSNASGTVYWTVLFSLVAVIVPLFFVGTGRLTVDERHRVQFFRIGFVAGFTPLIFAIVFGAVPRLGAWMTSPQNVEGMLLIIELPLASVALTVAYAIGVQRMLPLRVVLRKAIQYLLARVSVTAAFVLPIAALALHTYRHRHETIAAALLSGRTIWLLAGVGVTGAALLARERFLHWIDHWFFREAYDTREVLIDLSERSRRAQTLDELIVLMTAGIDRAFKPDHIAVLIQDADRALYISLFGAAEPLATSAVLAELLGLTAQPISVDLEDPHSPIRWLPRGERQWLADSAATLLVPMRVPHGELVGFIALGARKSELPYARDDRRLLAAIGDACAFTIQQQVIRALPDRSEPGLGQLRPDPKAARAEECESCGRTFQMGTARCQACSRALQPAEVPFVLMGKFQFEQRIGRGGMGVVYQARDVALDRLVAVKTLPDTSPEQSQRLRTEAKAMAAVTHPNLATIYGAESWHGKPLLVCEFMPLGTLADRLSASVIPLEEALALGIALAEALAAIHASGLLHRDIKPSNIGYAERRVPKLLDFGLVHILTQNDPLPAQSSAPAGPASASTSLLSLSVAQSLIGTPLYLSPEAAQGAPPSPAFDLWSLNVLLLEAITGGHPFRGRTLEDTLDRIHAADLSEPLRVVGRMSPDVASYFQQALARNESLRPRHAAEIADRLKALVSAARP